MKQNNKSEIYFHHAFYNGGDTFLLEAAKTNYIFFLTKGSAVLNLNTDIQNRLYIAGDIVFIPISANINITFKIDAEMLLLSFGNNIDVFSEIQKIIATDEPSSFSEEIGHLRIKYPLNFFVTLLVRYIEDEVMTPELSHYKLAELFMILKKYYGEDEMKRLFLPIVSTYPEFKLLVFSKFKYSQNVDELAKACNMGKRIFERKFKLSFDGVTPYNWIQIQKKNGVLKRLSMSGVTLSDIIAEFNFYDASHFNKFCKQHYSQTPDVLLKAKRDIL